MVNINIVHKYNKNGINIICDRYSYSGIAYSSSKEIKDDENMSLNWCKTSESGLPKPDLVLFLNLSVEEAQKRGNYGDERYEKLEFQKKVKNAFDILIRNESLNNKYTKWNVINANNEIDNIHKEIVKVVDETINELNDDKNTKDIELYKEN